nr:hypothetical protein [Tanacetum cinerariifolium]
LKENLESHSPDFQNTFEPSNASTNVFNGPREPYVVKQDNGSFVDKIIFYLNRAPDSPNQFHCFHCKDMLRDGEACKRCTCVKYGSGLGKGLCYICGHNQNSLNASPIVQKKLEEKQLEEERAAKAKYWKLPVCYDDDDDEERSDSLDDNIISGLPPFSAITPDELVLSTEEPNNSLSMRDEHLYTIPATESDEFIKSGVENLIPIPSESVEISSGSTTTPPYISLPKYEVFYDDHVKEISSGIPLLILILLFMLRSSLIFRSTYFLLPIGVIFMSSPMNSFPSYRHQSMIVSFSRLNQTRGILPRMW